MSSINEPTIEVDDHAVTASRNGFCIVVWNLNSDGCSLYKNLRILAMEERNGRRRPLHGAFTKLGIDTQRTDIQVGVAKLIFDELYPLYERGEGMFRAFDRLSKASQAWYIENIRAYTSGTGRAVSLDSGLLATLLGSEGDEPSCDDLPAGMQRQMTNR